ncbi:hypothetical protein H8356DRAFT_1739105, partial [Neocallimastix lanati (nom. inval.)]
MMKIYSCLIQYLQIILYLRIMFSALILTCGMLVWDTFIIMISKILSLSILNTIMIKIVANAKSL